MSESQENAQKPSDKDPHPIPRLARDRWLLWVLIGAMLIIWAGPALFGTGGAKSITYSEFKQHLARGELERVFVEENLIRGTLEEVSPKPEGIEPPLAEPTTKKFRAVRVEDPDLISELDSAGVEYTGVRPSPFADVFLMILPIGLVLLAILWISRGVARGAGAPLMGFGRSKAKLAPETGTGVTFDDVAGCDEAKQDLREMVEFLKHPERFTALGALIPKGVLLLGPPGTGKTLLARAVAGEAGVPFFSISGSDFVEMFVGVGAARVRDLFDQAKAKAPCIVFVDEIDAVGRQRGVSMGVVNDEREQTLNQLLSEMDGFEENSGVILLAATNRPEVLDRALLRPGRFDRQIVLDSPDRSGRKAILEVHARGKPLGADVDLERIARATPGMSGADLANALNEAALAAARQQRTEITHAEIEAAIERVMAGPERRSRRLGPDEKRRVAYHESGHALVAAYSEHADPVQKISIVPRGRAALGYTMQLPEEEQFLRTREELEDSLKVLLAGRASEELVLESLSTGARDDLQTATALARQMICTFGMNERVGLQTCARPAEGIYLKGEGALQRDCSEATAREIDEEVKHLLERAHAGARRLLEERRSKLDAVAEALLEREALDRAEFERIIGTGH